MHCCQCVSDVVKTGLAIQQEALRDTLADIELVIEDWYHAYNRRMPDWYPFIDLNHVQDGMAYVDEFNSIIWNEADRYSVRCLEMDLSLVRPSICTIPLLHGNERLLAMSVLDSSMAYFLAFLLICNDDDGSTYVRIKSDQQDLRIMWPSLYDSSVVLPDLAEDGDNGSVLYYGVKSFYRAFFRVQIRQLESAIEEWALDGHMDDLYCHGPVYIGYDQERVLPEQFSRLGEEPVGYEVRVLSVDPDFDYTYDRLVFKRSSTDAYIVVSLTRDPRNGLFDIDVITDDDPRGRKWWHESAYHQ